MVDEGFKRKLAAILSADVEGYSRLMGDDEVATVKNLAAYKEVFTSLILQNRGRVVDSTGDALLAEFASVVDAVQCAVAVQKELTNRNNKLSENRMMQFRIGVNLGDVIEEDDLIYGDGVNVAARLQSLAEPGGICISKTAFDQIESKLPYGYDFIGEKTVKNIAKPVGAYRVLMDPRVMVSGKPIGKKVFSIRRVSIYTGAALLCLLIVAAGIWQFYSRRVSVEPALEKNMAYSLPDKPSIVVLPFVNISNDPDLEYLCDGFTDNFISILSKNPWVFVIASSSSFSYKGKRVKVNMVAEELGVQYVIEGSLQKSGDQIRIAVQLIDALTGHHILAERFDRNLKDLFKLQDEIIFAILQSMNVIGNVDKLQSQYSVYTNNSNAYLKFMEGTYYMRFFSEDSLVKAQKAFKEAIALDPNFAQVYCILSYTYQQMGRYYAPSAESRKKYYKKALKAAEKSLELDVSQADSHCQLGRYYLLQKYFEKAIPSYSKAVELEPGNGRIRGEFSEFLTFMHKLPQAVYQGKEAIRLDPLSPANPLILGRAYFHLRQYEDAIEMHKKSLELMKYIPFNPTWPHLHLSMVYSELGNDEEARTHMKKVLEFYPRFNLEERRNALFFEDTANADREIEALRKAGAPEHPPTS